MMKPYTTLRVGAVTALVAHALNAGAADWPCFRGTDASGMASDANPPLTWSDDDNVSWKTALPGPGSSSPIVVGDRVFVTCYSGYGLREGGGRMGDLKRHLVCMGRDSGKILWTATVPAEMPEDPYLGYITEHGYASSTPASDGHQVFVFYGKTGVLAYDMEGQEQWRVNVGKQSSNRQWGSAVCLDAASGEEVYKERLPEASAKGRGGRPFYASAVLANGHVYAVSRWNGTFVFAATPNFQLLHHNQFESDESQFNGTPALSGREMFLRSDKFLYCLENNSEHALALPEDR